VAEPAVTPVAEPAVTPAAEPAAVPAVTPVAEPAVAPAAEPAAVPAVTPVAEPAVAPAAEPADTPAAPPVAEPAVLQLDRIYFGFDNAQLTDQGKAVLNQILDLLNSNTALKLKLLGHADAKGSDEYNRRLSQKRAEEAMRYLAARGIPVSRLSSLGLGEKEFVAINSNADGSDSPEGRYFNRRVEYEITGVDHITLRIILPPIPENLRIRE
jgi:OOP family OmpA-OmpF porin